MENTGKPTKKIELMWRNIKLMLQRWETERIKNITASYTQYHIHTKNVWWRPIWEHVESKRPECVDECRCLGKEPTLLGLERATEIEPSMTLICYDHVQVYQMALDSLYHFIYIWLWQFFWPITARYLNAHLSKKGVDFQFSMVTILLTFVHILCSFFFRPFSETGITTR